MSHQAEGMLILILVSLKVTFCLFCTTKKRLPSCQICYLFYQEITDMFAPPFFLYSKIGNIHCRVSGLSVKSFLIIIINIW